jgi:phytoene dehydrogenase-like protein
MKNSIEGKNIIIIGSGIGGLSAGIILSLLSFRVTVVEKNTLPGGLMRSYRRAGIDCPVGVHYVGALGEDEPLGKMFSLLGIPVNELFARMGQKGVIDRYIFDDFTFDLPPNIDTYEKNLRKSFPQDDTAINIIIKNLREIMGRMRNPSFLFNQGDPFQNIDYYQPIGEFLDKLGASAGLRAVIGVPCQLFGVPPADCPMILHHMVLAGYLFSAWRLKENGAKMADVFANRFSELGGRLVLNDAVEKVLLESEKVTGVRLKSGLELLADAIIADIHPKILLELLPPDSFRPSYRQRILDLTETEGVIAVQVSVDAATHPEMTHNIYRLTIDEKGTIEDGVFYQIRRGNNQTNLLSIITKSLYSEWSQWENTSSGKRGKAYEEKKQKIARELLQKAEKIFGSLKNAKIIDIFTPLTIRDYVNCPEGSCYGVMRSARQLLKVASINNIPISGLFLAGQNALAPGVLGSILGAFNLLEQIIGVERFNQTIKWDS